MNLTRRELKYIVDKKCLNDMDRYVPDFEDEDLNIPREKEVLTRFYEENQIPGIKVHLVIDSEIKRGNMCLTVDGTPIVSGNIYNVVFAGSHENSAILAAIVDGETALNLDVETVGKLTGLVRLSD